MAIVSTGSRHTQNTNYIIAVACILFACWFLYDGWFNEDFIKEQEEKNEYLTIRLNQYYVPIGCAGAAVFFVLSAYRLKSRKITAGQSDLEFSDGLKIAYNDIQQIDKRFFKKEGHFTVHYKEDSGEDKKIKLTDRTYDGLGLLLDEIVRQTGAAPAETDSAEDNESKTENA